jgi:hypothetical protein
MVIFVFELWHNAGRSGCRDFALAGKKEAQIEIQAVAKIQYPIKSHIVYCKLNSTHFKAENVRFCVEVCGG